MRHLSAMLLLCWIGAVCLGASEPARDLLRQGSYVLHDIRVRVGHAVPVKQARIRSLGDNNVYRRINAESRPGIHVSTHYTMTRLYAGFDSVRVGWLAGFGLAFDSHHGDSTFVHDMPGGVQAAGARVSCHALSLHGHAGLAMRFDTGAWPRLAPRSVQLEIGPFAGYGLALAQSDLVSDNTSDVGDYVTFGGQAALSMAVGRVTRVELAGGYRLFYADVEWGDQTRTSTLRGRGLFATLGLGWDL